MKLNISTTVEKKDLFVSQKLFNRFLPLKNEKSIFFWTFLPAALFLLNLAVSLLKPCFFTYYFPFIILVFAASIFKLRTWGLVGSYIILFFLIACFADKFSPIDCLWQMSIFFLVALNIFILLLSIEETEATLEKINQSDQELRTCVLETENAYQIVKKAAADQENEFKEEIEKLKKEAELRRLEKIEQSRKLELIESEIELLTSQKDEFVQDSIKARSSAAQYLHLLEIQKIKFEEIEECFKKELITSQELILEVQQRPAVVFEKIVEKITVIKDEADIKELLSLKSALTKAETISEQLHGQCEEKSQVLSQTRQELSLVQNQLAALEQENALSKHLPETYVKELSLLKSNLATAEGISKQLRLQFEEKSQVLSQTRKELFQLQGQLIAVEKEQALSKFNQNKEEIFPLEKDLVELTIELEEKSREVTHLEELISHILSL